MKKIYITLTLFATLSLQAQFTVAIQIPEDFKEKDAVLYILNGSKDIIASKESIKNNLLTFKYSKAYYGMMKVYFPSSNNIVSFISENKNVDIKLETQNNKIKDIIYLDEANNLMSNIQKRSQKKELILPALIQIKDYYKENSEFGKALRTEINRLSGTNNNFDSTKHPFISYYNSNYEKFLSNDSSKKISQDDIINFIDKSNNMLETSSLLRPLLVNYLNTGGNSNVSGSVDKLLQKLNLETPRGQTVLSELIDIFNAYGMNDLKDKYLGLAKNLKYTITDRLASTIKSNDNASIGSVFLNADLLHPVHTKAKTLYNIKANRKIIIFWLSTCSHCEKELPQLIPYYNQFKKDNIEIIGFSFDGNGTEYRAKAENYPWINSSELHGWYSSYSDKYNVHATPTYFILDANNKIISKPDHVGDVLKYFNLK